MITRRLTLAGVGKVSRREITSLMDGLAVDLPREAGRSIFRHELEFVPRLSGALHSSIAAGVNHTPNTRNAQPGATSNLNEYEAATRGMKPGDVIDIVSDAGFAAVEEFRFGGSKYTERAIDAADNDAPLNAALRRAELRMLKASRA